MSVATTAGAGSAAQVLHALAQELEGFQEALRELAELAGEKLAAMRAADGGALERCAVREEPLLRELFRREQERNAVLARAAQALRLPGGEGTTLSDLVAAVAEPLASSLRARMAGMRAAAEELQRKNRVVALVAQDMQKHIRGIFAEVAGVTAQAPLYGPAGRCDARATRAWVDAVG